MRSPVATSLIDAGNSSPSRLHPDERGSAFTKAAFSRLCSTRLLLCCLLDLRSMLADRVSQRELPQQLVVHTNPGPTASLVSPFIMHSIAENTEVVYNKKDLHFGNCSRTSAFLALCK